MKPDPDVSVTLLKGWSQYCPASAVTSWWCQGKFRGISIARKLLCPLCAAIGGWPWGQAAERHGKAEMAVRLDKFAIALVQPNCCFCPSIGGEKRWRWRKGSKALSQPFQCFCPHMGGEKRQRLQKGSDTLGLLLPPSCGKSEYS